MKKILVIGLCIACSYSVFSQKKWTLKDCIEYAIENNLDIKQRKIVQQSSENNLKSSKLSMLPDLNGNIGQNFGFGRSLSSTGLILNENSSSTSFGLSSGMPLFEGLRIYNQIESNKLNLQAALEDLNQAKDNISLMVTSQYLQILFNKELYKIALDETELGKKQLERTEQLVNVGSKSNADLYESRAVLARDKLNIVQRLNDIRLALLELAQLLDIRENIEEFDIVEPSTEEVLKLELLNFVMDNESLDKLSTRRADIKASEYRLKASEKDLNIVRSAHYPTLNFQASYGTGYYSTLPEQMLDPESGIMPFGKQLDINQQLTLGFGLRVPIFNRMSDYYSIKNAKLNIQSRQLELENSRKTFLNEIQQAYYNAIASGEKYTAAKEAKTASEEAFRYANEKYAAGKASVYEFEEAKLKMVRSESELAQAKYEFIFRTKILDFYNGKPLEF